MDHAILTDKEWPRCRVSVTLSAERQDAPPRLTAIAYVLSVETDATEHRLALTGSIVRG